MGACVVIYMVCEYNVNNSVFVNISKCMIGIYSSTETGKESTAKLEFKQRLSIAIGAAKGMLELSFPPKFSRVICSFLPYF